MQVNNVQVISSNDQTEARQELEIFDVGGTHMVTDGPLSTVFSEALHQLYRNEYDPISGAVMESLQLDESAIKTSWLAAKVDELIGKNSESVSMLYGVREGDASASDITNVANSFAEMTAQQIDNTAVVIVRENDPTKEGGASETAFIPPSAAALEQYAVWRGAKVYHSFDEFLRKHSC